MNRVYSERHCFDDAEGIPFPPGREGLPDEDKLLNAASPRSPASITHQTKSHVNTSFVPNNPLLKIQEDLSNSFREFIRDESMVLGIDVGLSCCALSLVAGNEIRYLGVRLFELAENPYTRELKQAERRKHRAQRLRYKRQARRRAGLRTLLAAHGMWPDEDRRARMQPLSLRAEALDRCLSPEEFGVALFHAAKRRGYVPRGYALPEYLPASTGAGEAPVGPIVAAATRNELRASSYRTVGEMLQRDPAFAARKRNRQGDYASAVSRPMLEAEVAVLFRAQRTLGSDAASEALQRAFEHTAFRQLPRRYPTSHHPCAFLPDEPLGPRRSPTMERYCFLDALTKLRLAERGEIRRLTPPEIAMVAERFGRTATVTRLDIRRWLALAPDVRFLGARSEDSDLVSPLGAAAGTVTLRNVLGRVLWKELGSIPGVIDALAAAVTGATEAREIEDRLTATPDVCDDVVSALVEAFEEGELTVFRARGRVSIAAAQAMIPFLEQGYLVFDAAIKAGFDRFAHEKRILHTVRQPRIYRPVLEVAKQVRALVRDIGVLPGRIHVEVAKDLGLTPDQRAAAEESYRKTAEARRTARNTVLDFLGTVEVNDALVDRYMLWQEQGGRCVYTGEPINVRQLLDGGQVQVDHIQPLSRSNDHSRHNTVVCLARANQAKGNLTPYEWRGSDIDWWRGFAGRIGWMPLAPRKRRLLLSKAFAEREGSVLNRNLNDTGYTARCVLTLLRGLYTESEGYRRVAARPGQLTAILRRAWGLTKERGDVRSHALDALVVAVAGDRTLFGLSAARRRNGSAVDMAVALPWPEFRLSVLAALSDVKISRAEQRRGRGSGHAKIIRGARFEADGERVLTERRPLHRLREADLARIPDPEMNGPLIQTLADWLAAGSPADCPPTSPQGDPIRHVRLRMTGKTGISRDGLPVRGGIAGFGDLVRADIYHTGQKYIVVPVHAADVATRTEPPIMAPVTRKLRKDWPRVEPDMPFLFSLYRNTLVRVARRDGRVTEGYFRGLEQRSVRLTLSDAMVPSETYRVPVNQAVLIEKFAMDRLGRRFPVRREVRTWRGGNAPWPPDGVCSQTWVGAKNKASLAEA